jgi:hypothetical protein
MNKRGAEERPQNSQNPENLAQFIDHGWSTVFIISATNEELHDTHGIEG